MILSFSKTFKHTDAETHFADRLITGQKAQTIRSGDKRKAGDKLHHWIGSPRNKGSYALHIPLKKATYWFYENEEKSMKGIFNQDELYSIVGYDLFSHDISVPVIYATESISIVNKRRSQRIFVGGRELGFMEMDSLASKDGFDSVHDFISFFFYNTKETEYYGQIIHWTSHNVYTPQTAKFIEI